MEFNLSGNIKRGNKQVGKVVLNGSIVWTKVAPGELPSILSFGIHSVGDGQLVLAYEVEDGGSDITEIAIDQGEINEFTPIGHTNLTDYLWYDELNNGQTYQFRLKVTNGIGSVLSELVTGTPTEGILLNETFTDASKVVDDIWRDNNNSPIGGAPATVRIQTENDEKFVQLKHLAFDQINGNYLGTRRIEHPFSFFNLVDPLTESAIKTPAATFEYDLYFENIWDFNTIARDAAELKFRLMEYSGVSESVAESIIDSFGDVRDTPYTATGFPYQTGKLHGIVSQIAPDEQGNPSPGPSGGQPPVDEEWSVRLVWVKDVNTHPTLVDGVYTEGADPAIMPGAALYYYGQDRVEGQFGKFIYVPDFRWEKERWYRIRMSVHINEVGKENGIISLEILDRTTLAVLGSVYADNIPLHSASSLNDAAIQRLMYSTFFGGGNIRYQPQIDPLWEPDVDVNNGVYMRNNNYQVKQDPYYSSPAIDSVVYQDNQILITLSHIEMLFIDGVEISRVAGSYTADSWVAATYSIVDGRAVVTVLNPVEDEKVRFRLAFGAKRSAITDSLTVVIPSEPSAPVLDSVVGKDQSLQIAFSAPASDGGSTITDYEYQLNGGSWVSLATANAGTEVIPGLVNGTSYSVKVRAVSAYGNGQESNAISATPFGEPVLSAYALHTEEDKRLRFSYTYDINGKAITNFQFSRDGGSWVGIPILDSSGTFTVSDLINGETYSVRIRLSNDNGANYVISAPVSGSPAKVPDAPLITSIDRGDQQLSVHFDVPGDGGRPITGYRYQFNGGAWVPATDQPPIDTGSPLVITGLSTGVEYSVRIRAVNEKGSGTQSNAVVQETLDAPSVNAYGATGLTEQIYFEWDVDNGGTALTEISIIIDGAQQVIASTAAVGNYTHDIAAGEYTVQMKFTNAIGVVTTSGVSVSASAVLPQANMFRYYDPNILSQPNGSSLTALSDLTGNSDLATASGSNAPTFKTNAINGLPSIKFSGGQALQDGGHGLIDLTDELHIFIVSRADGASIGALLQSSPFDVSNTITLHVPYTIGSDDLVAWDFGDRDSYSRLVESDDMVYNQFYCWEFVVKPGWMGVYRDGVLLYSRSQSSQVNLASHVLHMGRFIDDYFLGEIASVYVYSYAMAEYGEDRAAVLNYVKGTYGLAITVPVVAAPTVSLNPASVGDGTLSFPYSIEENGSALSSVSYTVNGVSKPALPLDLSGTIELTGLTNGDPQTVVLTAVNAEGSHSDEQTGTPEATVEVEQTVETTDDFTIIEPL